MDAALLLGPLYHLTERADRLAALREAARILKPGGFVFAAAISRFASALDGLANELLDDLDFVKIVLQDIQDGQHRNPFSDRNYFTTAYFHHPTELTSEVEEAGFQDCHLLALEGPAGLLQNFEHYWSDPQRRETLLTVLQRLESDPTLIGASCHFLAVAHK